jgi:Flp pilus assembly protein TadG
MALSSRTLDLSRLSRFLDAFARQRRGNVVMIFGLSVFVLMMAIGGAVDFSRVVMARHALQDASDAAVLRVMSMTRATDSERNLAAQNAFITDLKAKDTTIVSAGLTTETTGNTMTQAYSVNANVNTIFGQFIGMKQVSVSVVSKAQSMMMKSEIAFVLDTTGSMANDNKMVNLKSSVDSVLSSLLVNGVNVSGTKVAVVPFHKQVRLTAGTSYPYIDYGTQSSSETCKSGTNGYLCNALRDTYGKVCKSASNVADCKATIKAYSQTYTQTVSGVVRTYYNTYMVASYGGKVYKYAETTYTTSKTVSVTPVTTTDPETGATSTSGSTSTTTTHTLESQGASTGTASDYSNADTTKSTCFDSSKSATCFTAVAAGTITYSTGYSNGYGESAAVSKSVNSLFGSAAGTMWQNIPVITENKSKWLGCIIDRVHGTGYDYDASADAYDANAPKTLYNARDCVDSTLKPMQALTDNIKAQQDFVKTLAPGGKAATTNITIGVQWGMEALSPSIPLQGGVNFTDDSTKKYMIVVTDGINNANRDYGSANNANAPYIDARTSLACTNAKKLGITIFVIKVIEGNSDMLRACASRSDYFYDLSNSSQINTALASVFEAIKKTRLTQ